MQKNTKSPKKSTKQPTIHELMRTSSASQPPATRSKSYAAAVSPGTVPAYLHLGSEIPQTQDVDDVTFPTLTSIGRKRQRDSEENPLLTDDCESLDLFIDSAFLPRTLLATIPNSNTPAGEALQGTISHDYEPVNISEDEVWIDDDDPETMIASPKKQKTRASKTGKTKTKNQNTSLGMKRQSGSEELMKYYSLRKGEEATEKWIKAVMHATKNGITGSTYHRHFFVFADRPEDDLKFVRTTRGAEDIVCLVCGSKIKNKIGNVSTHCKGQKHVLALSSLTGDQINRINFYYFLPFLHLMLIDHN